MIIQAGLSTMTSLSALARLRYNNLIAFVKYGVKNDYHPMGVQIFLYYWVKIFGKSEASVRLAFHNSRSTLSISIYLIASKCFK